MDDAPDNETVISTRINGRRINRRIENRLTLAEFLREKEGLRGTKVSCESQVCGACTVLVGGEPVSSCTVLAVEADQAEVTTIEGLGTPAGLDPVQAAFADCTALQCGYCTPGFVMATKALLSRNPDPTREEIEHELEGNLCRCTGYLPIIEAVQQAAARIAGTYDPHAAHRPYAGHLKEDGEPYRYVGRPVERVDARVKVTGQARFAIDIPFPDTAYAVAARSDRAHATILGIDTLAALDVPGVIAVVTGEDLEGLYPRFGHMVPDHAIIAIGKVRYYGEPVALVVADSRHAAYDATRLIKVRYEDLPAAMDADAALAPGAPMIHEDTYSGDTVSLVKVVRSTDNPNVANTIDLGWGDVEAGFAEADLVVKTETYHPALYAFAMEPYNSSARFVDDVLEITSTAQHPFMVIKDVARVFDLPHSKVRLTVPFIGGGYGSKSYTKVEPLAAVGAWASGRPVKLDLSIEESIYTTRADAARTTVRSAFRSDGTLLARDIDIVLDTGAYVDNSNTVLSKATARCFGPYAIPNLRVRGRLVYTNTVPASSYRALGAFQVNLAAETNMDQAAEQLGIDPAEIRRMNLVPRGERFMEGKRPMDTDLVEDFDELMALLRIEPHDGVLQAVGFGVGANEGGAYPTSTAQVKMSPDGSALVLSGSTEMGQGSRSVLTQIAAEELGLDIARVRVFQSDSSGTSFERTTGGSRTTTMTGLAVQRACRDIVTQLLSMAATNWECAVEDVSHVGDRIVHADGRSEEFGPIIKKWYGAGGGEITGRGTVRREGELQMQPSFWEIGMVGVALDIDPETGVTKVDQLVTVADVGFAINPVGVEGQDLGAAVQGIGGGLTEELVYEGSQLRNPNLVEYRVPHINDAPRRFDSVIMERRDGTGPYGAKGVGEGARIPMGGAIAAAVARATGVWPTSLPLTPERVWNLIQEGRRRQDEHPV
ncbi:MAG TPA: molybdopterin-dependent oxidoreductase [Marmoricola sp.]|jgi:CO/xanthine dehydrogenase Mo-binding subunit/aerobic-type carbon monoxide dehydrogenase small subunit (CoxS/CutS family)|nr:molybdopterin-dependent oxidoreductase [Marmoricola sp.]